MRRNVSSSWGEIDEEGGGKGTQTYQDGRKRERVDAVDEHKVSVYNSYVTYQFGYIHVLNN